MSDALGQRLVELERGDRVVATVDDERYAGRVVRTTRHKCELVHGFMESGSASVELELDEATRERVEPGTAHVFLRATETAPRSWEPVEAVTSGAAMGETGGRIGTVTDLLER